MKTLVRIAMGLVAAAAFALSFQSLMELGRLAGYGGLSWLYPVVVDLGTVSSCAAWLATRSKQAFWMTWVLLSVSVVQNGTVHWLIATGDRPAWWLITLVATVPPATLGVVTHLAVGLGAHTTASVVPAEPVEGQGPGDGPADVDEHEQVSAADPLLDQARALADEVGRPPGRPLLKERLGVSDWKARQLAEALSSTNGNGPADV